MLLPALLLVSLAASAPAFLPRTPVLHRTGPPPAHTGGFGEPTCHACHWDNEPGGGGGRIDIRGFPEIWAAGATYPIDVVLHQRALGRGGFQLTVRHADGPREGRDAGTVLVREGVASLISSEAGVTYAQHIEAGTVPLWTDSTLWRVAWIAPREGDVIVLNIAVNAANDDDSPFGDFVHSATASSRRLLAPGSSVDRIQVSDPAPASVARAIDARARAATSSAVKPSSRITRSPGADAPKRSSPSTSPCGPATPCQPRRAPASTTTRAVSVEGRIDSR